MSASEPLVVVENVQKHYGEFQALTDIDLTIDRGEVVVIIGPSGSGKSTLCRSINRLETITSGSIRVALRAGMLAAVAAITASRHATPINVARSSGTTPKSRAAR